jgi:hypothetical protein
MTDNTVSTPAPGPQDQPCPNQASGSSAPGGSQSSPPWEVITFPGQIAVTDGPNSTPARPQGVDPATHRTEDLIQLIQDLNQCNDALLIRVSDLEESLERSQSALQAEIDRYQAQSSVGVNRAAMATPIAQLLSELDGANDGLRRATIHNETLQTELESSQQRVAQLEREYTLLQQRFSEKTTALQQAEDSCRDLKARLHRQQRYTLQFKTALEKCLKAYDASPSVVAAGSGPGLTETMPKTEKIQPWSAPNLVADQPHPLSSLIQGLNPPSPASASGSVETAPGGLRPSAQSAFVPFPPGTERAMEGAIEEILEAIGQKAPTTSGPARADDTTISLPPSFEEAVTNMAFNTAPPENHQTFPPVTDPCQPPTDTPNLDFTEPSPWGAPLKAPAASTPSAAPAPSSTMPDLSAVEPRSDWPGVSVQPTWAAPIQMAQAQPPTTPTPPVAQSQSPQRKRQSLATVQLPSFGRPPRRSP